MCVCLCLSVLSPPPTPPRLWGWTAESPPHPHDPSPPFPHPHPQAIARPTPEKNYPLKSAWIRPKGGREETGSPKRPFWTTLSPHDAFSAPLARSESFETFFLGGRQSIAQKGVRAIDPRNSQLENDSNAVKTSVRAPGLSADEREHSFVWCFGAGWFSGNNLARRKITSKNKITLRGYFYSDAKESTKINFLGPETARWGGGLPCEGVVAKKFVPSLESLSSLGFEDRNPGCPRNFAGCPRPLGMFKKFVQKQFVRILRCLFIFVWKGISEGSFKNNLRKLKIILEAKIASNGSEGKAFWWSRTHSCHQRPKEYEIEKRLERRGKTFMMDYAPNKQ